jgi:hypothetical protein
VENNGGMAGSRAIIADGGNLTVENCWLKGFDTALEVHASGGSRTQIRETMAISAVQTPWLATPGSTTLAAVRESAGWALRVELMGGNRRGADRRLILEHCTVTGAGLLKLAGFSQTSPVQVEVKGCAMQTKTLIGWEPNPGGTPFDRRALQWQGEGNQLDVTGPSWILQSAIAATNSPSEVASLDSWSQLARESEPVAGGIEFLPNPKGRPESPRPHDFAVKSSAGRRVGADPRAVGPRGPLRQGSS